MKIGLFVHKIYHFEPDTGKNMQDHGDAKKNVVCMMLYHWMP